MSRAPAGNFLATAEATGREAIERALCPSGTENLFWDPDREAHGIDQSSDEVSVNRSPRGGGVFGDRTAGIIRHEEFITH